MGFLDDHSSQVVESGFATIEGKEFPYFVLRQEANPQILGFIGIDDGRLYISDWVPRRFRNYQLWHEVQCGLLRPQTAGHCWHTIRDEIQRVPEELRSEYIPFRRHQFQHLVEYCIGKNGDAPDLLDEYKQAFAHLCSYAE